jgi:predicted DNA-binding transcriptional regulator AlpA
MPSESPSSDHRSQARTQRARKRLARKPDRVAEIRAAAPPPDEFEERLLNKAEVITITGKSFPTLWMWMRQGRFPAARTVGGAPAWLKTEVDAWIKELPVRRFKR